MGGLKKNPPKGDGGKGGEEVIIPTMGVYLCEWIYSRIYTNWVERIR